MLNINPDLGIVQIGSSQEGVVGRRAAKSSKRDLREEHQTTPKQKEKEMIISKM
jgi:hypothetical protein